MEDEASQASNPHSPPGSPNQGSSTYGTPADHTMADSSPAAGKASEKDPQLVVGAGRSLKNMLVDLMNVLQQQAKTQIFIQGDIVLRVEGRESYTIALYNEDNVEPSNLKVRIDKATGATRPRMPQLNGAADVSMSRKRQSEHMDLTNEQDTNSKRRRGEHEQGQDRASKMPHDHEEPRDREGSEPPPNFQNKLQNISAQIKWVEECRRIADEAHDRREDTWRSTSATFHDENRRARERHEAWMVSEMAWQRNMLTGLTNDIKGLYPLGHSLKWETPPHIVPPAPGPSPIPMPGQSSHGPYNAKQTSRHSGLTKPK